MNLNSQKRIAARILKCGISRVKIETSKEVEDALTRQDIRNLIRKGLIKKVQKKGAARIKTKKKLKQKRKGRRMGMGSRTGSKKTRNPKKRAWIKTVRPLRRLLRDLRDSEKIDSKDYSKLYLKVKGGTFRNKKHLLLFLKDHELLKTQSKKKVKGAQTKNKVDKRGKKQGS